MDRQDCYRSPLRPPVWAAALLASVLAGASLAAPAGTSGRVWLIDSHRAAVWDGEGWTSRNLDYWRLEANGPWVAADRAGFLEAVNGAGVPTAVFVHGNLTDTEAAIREAWSVYCRMERAAAGRPFQFVIWSWPSDRVCRRLRADAQLKADFSDVQAYYLADLLRDVGQRVPVSLIGYSYGSRTVAGALHLLAGGELAGRSLHGPTAAARSGGPRCLIRAILLAAAMDADWLLPAHRYGLAATQAEHLLVTQNCADRALRWYSRLYGRHGPAALGHGGPARCLPADAGQNIELIDVTCPVGRVHDWIRYVSAPALEPRWAWYMFLPGG